MTAEEAAVAVVGALERTGIPYMVVGSLASNLYGIPRSTQDVDIVIQWAPGTLPALTSTLGPRFQLDPQMSFETVTGTTRNIVRVTGTAFTVELFRLSDDPHDQERFARRTRIEYAGHAMCVPSPEDVVITKLRWAVQGARKKDREDATNVIAVQQHRLDWDYVTRWCREHGTLETLEGIRDSLPPI